MLGPATLKVGTSSNHHYVGVEIVKKLAVLCFLFALTTAVVWGQATAQIHGIVQDMSGSAIPAAAVKATQTDTGIVRNTNSEADGSFVLTNLPIGPYNLEITKEGFTTAVQTGIVLQVNSDPVMQVALKVGAVSERVNVEANATQVETRSVGVGTVIENQRVLDLPLNGRQPTDLICAFQWGGSDRHFAGLWHENGRKNFRGRWQRGWRPI